MGQHKIMSGTMTCLIPQTKETVAMSNSLAFYLNMMHSLRLFLNMHCHSDEPKKKKKKVTGKKITHYGQINTALK